MKKEIYMQYSDILGKDFRGQFIAKLIDIEEDQDDSTQRVFVLNVNGHQFKIRKPRTKGWEYKFKGDTFVVTKTIINKRGILYATDAFETNGEERNISECDIYDIQASDNIKPNIISLTIIKDVPKSHYIIYHNKKVYKIRKTFKFDNPYKVTAGLGVRVFLDISNTKERIVTLLGLNYHDAKLLYLKNHRQDKYDVKMFDNPPVTKDKHIKFHITRNIKLVNRHYTGLLLLNPREEIREDKDVNSRKYLFAEINEKDIVVLSMSGRDEWSNISGKDMLVVQKVIYPADDGKNLAKLLIIKEVKNYDNVEPINLYDLLLHKYGTKPKLDIEVICLLDNYLVLYAESMLYKISIETIPNNMLEKISEGNKMFRLKPTDTQGVIDVYTVRKQTRLLQKEV